jgi:hypothetical protein
MTLNLLYLDKIGKEFVLLDLTTGKLKQVNLAGIGSVDVSWNGSTASYSKQYALKDHLGSVRRSVLANGTLV